MTVKEKLIASGMDEAEAERIAAILGAEAETSEAAEAEAEAETTEAAEAEAAEEAEATEASEEAEAEAAEETEAAEAEAAETSEAAEADEETEAAETSEAAEAAEAIEETEETKVGAGTELDALREANLALRERVIDAELRGCALAAGVKPERIATLRKLVETSQIDAAAQDISAQMAEAVRAALREVPELAAAPYVSTGSLGGHPRESQNPPDPFARGLAGA